MGLTPKNVEANPSPKYRKIQTTSVPLQRYKSLHYPAGKYCQTYRPEG